MFSPAIVVCVVGLVSMGVARIDVLWGNAYSDRDAIVYIMRVSRSPYGFVFTMYWSSSLSSCSRDFVGCAVDLPENENGLWVVC